MVMEEPTHCSNQSDASAEAAVIAIPREDESVSLNRTVKIGNAVLSQEDAAKIMQQLMNNDARATDATWFDTNENNDSNDDPVEKDLCSPTAGIKFGFTSRYVFVVNLSGNVMKWDVLKIFLRILLVALVLVSLWLALGSLAQPGGAVFALVTTILFGAVVGHALAKVLSLPPMIGFLIAGVIWGSTGWAEGRPYLFYSCVRTAALTTILCRAGINFKWSIIKPVALNIALIGIIPQLSEGITHASIARFVFPHENWLSAILQGAVVSATSSAVIITVIYPLRAAGYSVSRGPGLLMYIACAADSVFAVFIVNFILGIMYPGGAGLPLWQRLLMAPAQIILGVILGVICGRIIYMYSNMYFKRNEGLTEGWKEIAEEYSKRDTALFILFSQGALVLLANYLNLPGTGTVAAACAAATISHLWAGNNMDDRKNDLNKTLAGIWDSIIAPMLFSLVGASIRVEQVTTRDFLPPALLCIFGGLAVKSLVIVGLQAGTGCSWKEKLFFAIGFTSKSTVQAAMGGKFLDYALTKWDSHGPEEESSAEQEIAIAKVVQQISVCSILICAILGGTMMKLTGKHLLVKDEDFYAEQAAREKAEEERKQEEKSK